MTPFNSPLNRRTTPSETSYPSDEASTSDHDQSSTHSFHSAQSIESPPFPGATGDSRVRPELMNIHPISPPGPMTQLIFSDIRHLQAPQLRTTLSLIRTALPARPTQSEQMSDTSINLEVVQHIITAGQLIARDALHWDQEEIETMDHFSGSRDDRHYNITIESEPYTPVQLDQIAPTLDRIYQNHAHIPLGRPDAPQAHPQENTLNMRLTASEVHALIRLFSMADALPPQTLAMNETDTNRHEPPASHAAQQPLPQGSTQHPQAQAGIEAHFNPRRTIPFAYDERAFDDSTVYTNTDRRTSPLIRYNAFVRGEELKNLIEYVSHNPTSQSQLQYLHEPGIGEGPTREIYTEAFKQFEESHIFQVDSQSGALNPIHLPDVIENPASRRLTFDSLVGIGQVMASLYLRNSHEHKITVCTHFSDEIYHAIEVLNSEHTLDIDESASLLSAPAHLLFFMYDAIWESNLSHPETPRTPEEEHELIELLGLRDLLAPFIALSSGFNQINALNANFPDIKADILKRSFSGFTLRQALEHRAMSELFTINCSNGHPAIHSPLTNDELKTNAAHFLERYILSDPQVSEQDIKALTQFITAESYITESAVLKIDIARSAPNLSPRPQARTCFRTLKLTDKHLADYESFHSSIREAIVENGHEITRGD